MTFWRLRDWPLAPSTLQQPARTTRLLLKGGCVVSLDPAVGEFEKADVLIDGNRIAEVRPSITASATTIDATDMIVMPGFIDTHRHMWEGPLRNILPNGSVERLHAGHHRNGASCLSAGGRPDRQSRQRLGASTPASRRCWTGRTSGTVHSTRTPQSRRCVNPVFARSTRMAEDAGPAESVSGTISAGYVDSTFRPSDQLLTLAMATGPSPSDWRIAREVGAPITLHLRGPNSLA